MARLVPTEGRRPANRLAARPPVPCAPRQRFRVESRPNFPRKQKFLFFVVPDEHRAEMLTRALRRREPTDDQFLFVHALEFDPRAAAPARFINRAAQFSD